MIAAATRRVLAVVSRGLRAARIVIAGLALLAQTVGPATAWASAPDTAALGDFDRATICRAGSLPGGNAPRRDGHHPSACLLCPLCLVIGLLALPAPASLVLAGPVPPTAIWPRGTEGRAPTTRAARLAGLPRGPPSPA